MNPVLVTDGISRKSLAVVRSLGSKGVSVYSAETTRLTPSGWSKYCRGAVRYPSPSDKKEAFSQWLLDEAVSKPGLVLFPMDELTVLTVLEKREELLAKAPDSRILLPELRAFELAADKFETVKAATDVGLKVPKAWCPANTEELESLIDVTDYPLVIKPRNSSGSRGIRIVHDRQQLISGYEDAIKDYAMPMIQEYIPLGPRFDVALLYDGEGKLVASFAQRELRHYPADIGPSTVQQSVWMPELVRMSAMLVESFGWRGIAEVEWMQDPRDGSFKLMEINPRYWNSLHLSVQSGVDFPYLHYRLALGEKVEPVHEYKIGQITRNLLPGDLLHALSVRKLSLDPPMLSRKGLPIQDDIWSRDDPMAAAGFVGSCLRYLFDGKMWKTVVRR